MNKALVKTDFNFPKQTSVGIPYKGQMLNQIAAKFLDATTDICPNWKLATPDPMVTVGVLCQGFPVEMIVRGYLCGSAWRAYTGGHAREPTLPGAHHHPDNQG